jgi:hypothetical protein
VTVLVVTCVGAYVAIGVVIGREFVAQCIYDTEPDALAGLGFLFAGTLWPAFVLGWLVAKLGKAVRS